MEEHQRAAVIERERASRKTEQQGASSGAESTSGKSPTVETEDLGDLVWLGRDGLLVVDEEATKSVKTLSTIIKVIAFLIMVSYHCYQRTVSESVRIQAAGIACMLTPFQCFSAALAVGVGHFYAATLRNIEALQVVRMKKTSPSMLLIRHIEIGVLDRGSLHSYCYDRLGLGSCLQQRLCCLFSSTSIELSIRCNREYRSFYVCRYYCCTYSKSHGLSIYLVLKS